MSRKINFNFLYMTIIEKNTLYIYFIIDVHIDNISSCFRISYIFICMFTLIKIAHRGAGHGLFKIPRGHSLLCDCNPLLSFTNQIIHFTPFPQLRMPDYCSIPYNEIRLLYLQTRQHLCNEIHVTEVTLCCQIYVSKLLESYWKVNLNLYFFCVNHIVLKK